MLTVLLALGAALSYGASDFLGGRAATRVSYVTVTGVVQATGVVLALGLALLNGTGPQSSALAWGAAAGIGSALGTLFLYRGLARARVAVVAPLSGVLAAALPALLGIVVDGRPSTLTLIGIVVALPSVWLISAGGAVQPDADRRPSGVLDGLLAGLGFGLLFLALDRAGDGAGLWPIAASQIGAFVLLVPLMVGARRRRAAPARTGSTPGTGDTRGTSGTSASAVGRTGWAPMSIAAGVLGTTASLLFFLATNAGLLTVAAVITALYPAGTIALGRIVLAERISSTQAVGLALAGVAVVLITLG